MDKSPDAFRTISEVADWLGTPAHVLRFWESRFSQVKPVKRAGGRRYYRPSDMVLLGGIKKLLHDDGMTIRGVQKLLREHGVRYVASMSPHLDGVAPVAPLAESVGPVPAAPMAEDVPTGAFDEEPAAAAEKIVPFSRPDIPAQPAPNAQPETGQPVADLAMNSTETEKSLSDTGDMPPQSLESFENQDIPEAPMVDVDAPFSPTADPQEHITTHTATPPAAPAQVTFDFDDVGTTDEAVQNAASTPLAPALDDESAFETALQDALDASDHDLDAADFHNGEDEDLESSVVAPASELELPTVPVIAETVPDTHDAAALSAPDIATETTETINEPNQHLDNDVISSELTLAPTHMADIEQADAETSTPAEIEINEVASATAVADQPRVVIPDDLDDDAPGLDTELGVVGRLNTNALASADPAHIQAIFDRVTALQAKLSQSK